MDSEKEEVKVGVFIALGLALLMAMILAFGGDKIFFHSYYILTSYFSSVDGLAKGSVVSLSGIVVGNISDISISEKNNLLKVEMRIDENFRSKITKGAIAKIRTKGALGDKFIFIEPGPINASPLADGEVLSSVNLGDFLSSLSENSSGVEDVFKIIKELHLLLRNINGDGRSLSLMNNVADASARLNEFLKTSEEVLLDIRGDLNKDRRLRRSMEHLSSILEKVDSGQGTLGALINDPILHERLKELLGTSKKSSNLKSLIRKTIEKKGNPGELN